MKNINYLLCVLGVAMIGLSSCHSRRAALRDRAAMRGEPGELVKPQTNVADKYSAILGVDPGAIQNGRLYEFIDDWMGTPYHFGGQARDGIDCSGFAQLLEQQVYNVSLPRSTGEQVLVIKRKYEEELVEGDLVFFDYDGRKFGHVGVYLQNGYYVHASTSHGVMISKLHDPYTYKYFSRCGSIMVNMPNTELEGR